MCGIAGQIDFDGFVNVEKTRKNLSNLLAQLYHHRGPDDMGSYVDSWVSLGNTRLSIVGITNGRQPIFNGRKDVVGVINGEIYNAFDIRKTLEKKVTFSLLTPMLR